MPRRLLALATSARPPGPSRARRSVTLVLLSVLPALGLVFFSSGGASAHGAPMAPGSRTYLCWKYSLSSTGEVKPTNPACKAAYDKAVRRPSTTGSRCSARTARAAPRDSSRTASCAAARPPSMTSPGSTWAARTGR
ncbi:lytic polysaccharide monooxygenase [Streptomyces niphimycinicus]|uniref:lytic polysaccharide monooxygenase n=1 Tax=Streptomyces niphimycinicus TaxID=2842201 RepID=UPI0035574865